MNVGKPFLSKRILSAITDVVLLFLCFFLLSWASISWIVQPNPTYQSHQEGYTQILLSSGIYEERNGDVLFIQDHFEEGLAICYQTYEGKEEFEERKKESSLFDETGKVKEDADEKKVQEFYLLECQYAASKIQKSEDFARHYSYVFRFQMITYIICLLLSSFLLECVIPWCLKDGRTLGKKMNHLALVSGDGYRLKAWQIPVRWFAYLILNIVLGIVTYGFLPIFSLVTVLLNRYGKSFHDFIAGTIMVDDLNYKIEARPLTLEVKEEKEEKHETLE